LDKCMQVHQDPGQTAATLQTSTTPINVEVTKCADGNNQHYLIENGMIKTQLLTNKCLTADSAAAKANVHLATCVPNSPTQIWKMTHYGNIMLGDTNLCLDVMAALKADGTREKWNEIKQRDVVNVQLYTCHNPTTTDRVNQLWSWAPIVNGQQVTAMTPSGTSSTGTTNTGTVNTGTSSTGTGNTATASMPTNVAQAVSAQTVAGQGIVAQYSKDRVALPVDSLGLSVSMVAGVAVASSVVALVGLHRWYAGAGVAVGEEEVAVLDSEDNQL